MTYDLNPVASLLNISYSIITPIFNISTEMEDHFHLSDLKMQNLLLVQKTWELFLKYLDFNLVKPGSCFNKLHSLKMLWQVTPAPGGRKGFPFHLSPTQSNKFDDLQTKSVKKLHKTNGIIKQQQNYPRLVAYKKEKRTSRVTQWINLFTAQLDDLSLITGPQIKVVE